MKQIITIQHAQSVHHANGMVGPWTNGGACAFCTWRKGEWPVFGLALFA